MKSLSRGKGHSATAAAAYRAGIALDDPTTGERHDYTRRAGVVSVDLLAPPGAVGWATDPTQVWAEVEQKETRKNARVGREVVLALPHELDPEARRDLAREVGQLLVDRYGCAAQVAVHAPDKGGDERNHHAHILMTPRQVGADGFTDYAAKVYDEFKAGAEELKTLRAAIAERTNLALTRAGVAARVDHRRLEEQKAAAAERGDFVSAARLDRPATKHEGKATTQARRRGERLPRAQRNDRLKNAGERRWNNHTRRFETLKAQAAAEGRLQPVDEQALHARALVERRKADAQRLHAAAADEVAALDQTAQRKAAVQARAKRPASHKAGASKPRPAPSGGAHQGKGSAAVERAARSKDRTQVETTMADEANRVLARLIEEILAAARKALLRPEDLNPWQRATARAVLETHQQSQDAKEAHRKSAEARTQARATVRRARADRGHYGPPAADPLSKLRQAVGRPSVRDRQALQAQEAVAQAKHEAERAKKAREQAKQELEAAERAAEKARAQFAEAFGLEVPRFDAKPEQQFKPAPSTAPRPTLGQTPVPEPRRPRPR